MKLILSGILLAVVFVSAEPEQRNPFKEAPKLIDLINNDPNSTWTAGLNFNTNLPVSYLKRLMGLEWGNSSVVLPMAKPITHIQDNEIPEMFNAKYKWNYCNAIRKVRDQGDCGSCWAVATTSTFADRLCIASKGRYNTQLSAIALTSCCTQCGKGCDGGSAEAAWNYFKTHGVPTGGDYHSEQGCQPYSLRPCEHHVEGPRPSCPSLDPQITPACESECTNKKYKIPISRDLYKVSSSYRVEKSVTAIQKEIMANGPLSASIVVFEDFLSYKRGVYQNNPSSKKAGLHVVKLIGWGILDEVPYWIVENSWNSDWGDSGYIKVLQGKNVIGIESGLLGGIPIV